MPVHCSDAEALRRKQAQADERRKMEEEAKRQALFNAAANKK
jgi:hypothetical protein